MASILAWVDMNSGIGIVCQCVCVCVAVVLGWGWFKCFYCLLSVIVLTNDNNSAILVINKKMGKKMKMERIILREEKE